MGKKRIVKTEGATAEGQTGQALVKSVKKRLDAGVLYVQSTYNNTKVLLTDKKATLSLFLRVALWDSRVPKKERRLPPPKLAKCWVSERPL